MTTLANLRAALKDCPPARRRQQGKTLRLAEAFRTFDEAEAVYAAAKAELDEAFGEFSAGQRTNREEARSLLAMAGLVERKRL